MKRNESHLPPLRRGMALAAALVASHALYPAASAAMPFVPDQSNTGFVPTLFQSIRAIGPTGQEFTPETSQLTDVQLYTKDFDFLNDMGATLQVRIRSGSIGGPILGESLPVPFVSDYSGLSQFHFEPVTLTPGELHVIEVFILEGDNWGVGSYGFPDPPYSGGSQIVLGLPDPSNDLWFSEGSPAPTSVGEASWARIKSLYSE